MATEIVEPLVIDNFAEDGSGGATCRAADEAGDHGAGDGSAHGAGWSNQYADRRAGFRAGQGERDTAGCSGDRANCTASLVGAMASIDRIGLAFRARWDRA
ncbi:hypothetical protein [Burkholderia sp. OAS925]|uniref:hypothetical protein n=1 Tax=Paraburkholderia sp. OAS925 TaxID=2663827 RepID=UPI00178B7ECA